MFLLYSNLFLDAHCAACTQLGLIKHLHKLCLHIVMVFWTFSRKLVTGRDGGAVIRAVGNCRIPVLPSAGGEDCIRKGICRTLSLCGNHKQGAAEITY